MSIEQARTWGCCTMNEFRAFLGLKTFSSFEEWNSNPDVAVRLFFILRIRYTMSEYDFHRKRLSNFMGISTIWNSMSVSKRRLVLCHVLVFLCGANYDVFQDCMPLGPGSGICCGYTMTRAILGDAVALVRGGLLLLQTNSHYV